MHDITYFQFPLPNPSKVELSNLPAQTHFAGFANALKPQRPGNEATQAMLITGTNRFSQLKTCLAAAHHFLLSRQAAVEAIDWIETAIRDNWERVCGEAELSPVDKNYLWGRQFLNPFSIER